MFTGHIARRRSAAFTLVELLVVIGIIAILASMMVVGFGSTRRAAREAKCRSNLKQLAVGLEVYKSSYGDSVYFPKWITLLGRYPRNEPIISDARSFLCPDDYHDGAQGSRPEGFVNDDGSHFPTYPNADRTGIDPNDPSMEGVPDKCSYLFEMNGEKCDWYNGGVPNENEFQDRWNGPLGAPTADDFFKFVNLDGNNEISWYEMKMFTVHGWPGRLQGYGGKVPVVRCFWHIPGPVVHRKDPVLNIRYDFGVYRGSTHWEEDSGD